MATSPSTTPAPAVDAQLDQFIFHPDQFALELIPRRLPPEEVAKFICQRVDKSTTLKALLQTEKVVDYYDLYEVCEHLKGLLNRREVTPDERLRAAVVCRMVARVGGPSDRDFAREYFNYLLPRADQTPLLEALIGVFEALGDTDARALREKLEKRLQGLEPYRADASQRKHEYRQTDELLNQTLPRAQYANETKARLLGQKNRRARITEEVRVYLDLDTRYGAPEYLPSWAARRLRREVWAEQPEQQLTRADDPARRQEVSEILRQVYPSIARALKLPQEEKEFAELSCLRAIEFFGGSLSPQEQQRLERRKGVPFILSNE